MPRAWGLFRYYCPHGADVAPRVRRGETRPDLNPADITVVGVVADEARVAAAVASRSTARNSLITPA
jgi:hypothetical protein